MVQRSELCGADPRLAPLLDQYIVDEEQALDLLTDPDPVRRCNVVEILYEAASNNERVDRLIGLKALFYGADRGAVHENLAIENPWIKAIRINRILHAARKQHHQALHSQESPLP